MSERKTYEAQLVIDPGETGEEPRYVQKLNEKADEIMRKLGLFKRGEFDFVVRKELDPEREDQRELLIAGHTHYLHAEITL